MTQTKNRILDGVATMFANAASLSKSLRDEIDAIARSQVERVVNGLDLVQREEFEAVREMAIKAREDNEALKARIEALEKTAKPAGTAAKTRSRRTAKSTKSVNPGQTGQTTAKSKAGQ